MKQAITESIEIPDGITITLSDNTVTVHGKQDEIKRPLLIPHIAITLKEKRIELTCPRATKREKTHIYTTIAHLKNMIHGVQQPYHYTLKICSGHFPINTSITNNKLVVKNFLGEKVPRTMHIKPGVIVAIQGDKVTIESPNKELAGQTASEIELLTRISKRDPRVFQDGIYIIEKNGKPLP